MLHTEQRRPYTTVITGASGFIGRHVTLALSRHCRLYCLARRSQTEADIPCSSQISWIQGDIADKAQMEQIAEYIHSQGGADCVLHLAGYYDFSQQENPGYEATNVTGTRNTLQLAHTIQATHFMFSSSLAACEFTPPGHVVDESTPVSAQFPYARSKSQAERIIREHRSGMQASIIRLAAVYSDWCEFPPVYSLLETWLSGTIVSRALGGRGKFAIPYIHINDVIAAVIRIMNKANQLPALGVYNVSPNGATSHQALFRAATQYYFGKERSAFHVPKLLAWGALHLQSCFFRLLHKEPFERPWMAKYIDKQLNVRADATYQKLGWRPTPRYHILRRLLFLAENKRAHPNTWLFRNERMITQRTPQRRSLLIHRTLQENRERIVSEVVDKLIAGKQRSKFPHLSNAPHSSLHWFTDFIFQMVNFSIKTRDRYILSEATQAITPYCYAQGYTQSELKHYMHIFQETLKKYLLAQPNLGHYADRIHDFIDLNLQFIVDEIEDDYETMIHNESSGMQAKQASPQADLKEIFRFAHRVESLCGEPVMEPVLVPPPAQEKPS